MKLKTFSAKTVPEAMSAVNRLFGENAVIISSLRTPDSGVKLIVAADPMPGAEKLLTQEIEKKKKRLLYLKDKLSEHDLSESYFEKLLNSVMRRSSKLAEDKLLAAAFSEVYVFDSLLPVRKGGLYVFAGASGCGKTSLVAKLTFQAKTRHLRVACITMDKQKACGASELARYLGWMNVSCTYLNDMRQLNETVTMLRLSNDLILIDTPALNPYVEADMMYLKEIKVMLSDADMVYVQAAGMNAREAQTQGALFSNAGCTFLFGTKTDSVCDYSGLLQTVMFCNYRIAGWTSTSKITEVLPEATAENLTRLVKGRNGEKEEE